MIILGLEKCGPSAFLKVILFVKQLLDIVKFLIPMGLIVITSIDFGKSVISSKEDEMKKNFNIAIKRLLFGVAIFIIPSIVNTSMGLLGESGVGVGSCFANVSNKSLASINKMEEKENELLHAEIEEIPEPNFSHGNNYNVNPDGGNSSSAGSNASGCDGLIYYENGNFYKLSSPNQYNGREKSRGSAQSGYNKYFYEQLQKLVNDARAQGHIVMPSSTESGAWRPYEKQQYFWNCYQTGSCNNGNLAAHPGTSNHGWGIASDLSYSGLGTIEWAHSHAKDYGLHFPISSENWHIEPINLITDDEKVKKCL